ncbi:phospholipase [Candidatus Falkowbacteria bacterium]|nr:phospholipase [Candidatus Falkowbacteria bacterium]
MLKSELPSNKNFFWKRLLFLVIFIFVTAVLLEIYQTLKPLPIDLSMTGQEIVVNINDLSWLADETYTLDNKRLNKQTIFETIFSSIDNAEQYILVDMFLFNDGVGLDGTVSRALAKEFSEKLIAKKQANPDVRITVITDPINTVYGGAPNLIFKTMADAGISVIETKLSPLRDSNPLYSGPWRLLFYVFGTRGLTWLPNPFDAQGPAVTLRAWLAIPNFKANHRKVFLADSQGRWLSVIASANPHGGSSNHSNVAWLIKGGFGNEIYKAEMAVARLSGVELLPAPSNLIKDKEVGQNSYAKVTMLTEGKIKTKALELINSVGTTDSIRLAMFYLSDRDIVEALLAGAERGADIKLLLDPNKDAFGYQKNGIPNRPVVGELVEKSGGKIKVRWYDTQGEQFHTKQLLVEKGGMLSVLLGSANYTRRNLDDLNLEADALVTMPTKLPIARVITGRFDKWYNNQEGQYSLDYKSYQDNSFWKYWLYRFQEFSGMSSF